MQQLGRGQSLDKTEYKAAVKQISLEWRRMAKQDRDKYRVDASYEQACREELQQRPLKVGRTHGTHTDNPILAEQHDAAAAPQDLSTPALEEIAGDSPLWNWWGPHAHT